VTISRRALLLFVGVGLGECRGPGPSDTKVVEWRVPKDLAGPAAATERRPVGAPDFLDVRWEPLALVTDESYLYWVDSGHFEEEPSGPRYVADGAVWRTPVGGREARQVVGGLSIPSGLALTANDVIIAEKTGVVAVAKSGGTTRSFWSGERVTHVAVDGDAI
jgi:hypothetical protein